MVDNRAGVDAPHLHPSWDRGWKPPRPNKGSTHTRARKSGATPGRKPPRRALRPRGGTTARSWSKPTM
eukprot:14883814-Alexandrium_andersonii.AAC.1